MQRKGSRNKTAGLSPGVGTRSVHAADATQGASRSRVVDRALAARDAARITANTSPPRKSFANWMSCTPRHWPVPASE